MTNVGDPYPRVLSPWGNHMGRDALENGPNVEEEDVPCDDCNWEPGGEKCSFHADADNACSYCAGYGGWTSTFVDANDREYDAEYECPKCDGSGKR